MKNTFSENIKKLNFDEILIYSAFISVFLPYYMPVIFLIIACPFIAAKKNFEIYKQNNLPWLMIFVGYSAVVALFNSNFNGFGYSVMIFLITFFCVYVKNVITSEIFEKALTLCAFLGLITSFISIGDMIVFLMSGSNKLHRSTLYFFNCNYLATMLAIVVIICAYKFLFKKLNRFLCLIIAFFCAVSIYLTGSVFVWIEIFVGIAVLLKTTRRHQLLCVLLLCLATVFIIIYFVPEIIPRLNKIVNTTNNRVSIWKVSIEAFKDSPVFGQGFMTYKHVRANFPGAYMTSHSHNIIIECLMDFGIVGSVLLLVYILKFFCRLVVCRNAQSITYFSSLIMALLLSLIAHGTTDLTFLWSQTGFLYGLLMCGIGPEEKLLRL